MQEIPIIETPTSHLIAKGWKLICCCSSTTLEKSLWLTVVGPIMGVHHGRVAQPCHSLAPVHICAPYSLKFTFNIRLPMVLYNMEDAQYSLYCLFHRDHHIVDS